ncbi:hypothetical protein [Paraburkholderia sp.]|uniref:hypothetical protein n=1 Tax=Paraburkholderia sp. TaxID=1926495 RepID=UPI003C7CA16D
MTVFTYVTVGTNNFEKASTFYDNVLENIGHQRLAGFGANGAIWGKYSPSFFCAESVK